MAHGIGGAGPPHRSFYRFAPRAAHNITTQSPNPYRHMFAHAAVFLVEHPLRERTRMGLNKRVLGVAWWRARSLPRALADASLTGPYTIYTHHRYQVAYVAWTNTVPRSPCCFAPPPHLLLYIPFYTLPFTPHPHPSTLPTFNYTFAHMQTRTWVYCGWIKDTLPATVPHTPKATCPTTGAHLPTLPPPFMPFPSSLLLHTCPHHLYTYFPPSGFGCHYLPLTIRPGDISGQFRDSHLLPCHSSLDSIHTHAPIGHIL